MPWVRDNDGLVLTGIPHYNVHEIRQFIQELRRSKNQPQTICSMLENLLLTGRVSKDLVWRLSKWCDWNHWSEKVARSIADRCFHGIICRRLRDQSNRPLPDRATAEADYQTWLARVVEAGAGLQAGVVFPDEVDQSQTYFEGAVRRVSVNAYERNTDARAKCIDHYGPRCFVCRFEFGKAYDGVGQGYIHVHHLRKLSEVGCEYQVDPIADLRPVCPNCHSIIHLYREPFSIEDLRAMVARSRERHPDGPFA
jgi:hypothetical protein